MSPINEEKRNSALAALRHRSFRLYWSAQSVSLIGTAMQRASQAWLVLTMTASPLQLGLVGAMQLLPALFLGLIAGAIADRVCKRKLLLTTQLLFGLQAFILAGLVYTQRVQYWHVLALAAGQGICTAFAIPTRNSLVYDMVGKDDLMNAVALNSTIGNAAAIIGPAIGGLTMDKLGPAMAFFLNGVSYLFIVAALWVMEVRESTKSSAQGGFWRDIGEGVSFARRAPVIRETLLLVGLVGIFGLNYSVLVPVLAKDGLQLQGTGYGILMSFMGMGALLGAVTLAFVAHLTPPRRLLHGAAVALGALQILQAIPSSFTAAVVVLFLSGWAETFYGATSNSTLQMNTPDHLRGRMMGLFSFLDQGSGPIGYLFAGAALDLLGVSGGFMICGVTTVAATALVIRLGQRTAIAENVTTSN